MAGFNYYSGMDVSQGNPQGAGGAGSYMPVQRISNPMSQALPASSPGSVPYGAPAAGTYTPGVSGQPAASAANIPQNLSPSQGAFYLNSNAPAYLYNQNIPGNNPLQNSALNAGNGHVADADIPYLQQAGQNQTDPNYAFYKGGLGIDPSMAGTIAAAGYNPSLYSNIQQYYQQGSMAGPMQGVNYSFDPTFGVKGQAGNMSFDVGRMPGADGNLSSYANWLGQYFGSNVNQGTGSAYMGPSITDLRAAQQQQHSPFQWAGGGQNQYGYQGSYMGGVPGSVGAQKTYGGMQWI